MITRAAIVSAILVLATPVLPASTTARQTHPFDVHDLWNMDRISDPQVSPDGAWVVFASSTLDEEANRRTSDLWIVGTDGTGLRRLTTHPANESNARWAPDGSAVYFLSTRSGSAQVWRIAMDGGEAEPVTNLPLDVGSMAVSPDGTRLAVSLAVFPDCPDLACTVARLADENARVSSGVLYDHLFIRLWDRWEDGRRSHVFTVAVDGGDPPVDVMRGMDADCPSLPFGGPEEYTFTPDGTAVVFTAKVAPASEAWSTDFDLYLGHTNGDGPAVVLTENNRARDTRPVFGPDGTMAYLAMERPGFEADRFRIVLRDGPQGADRVLTQDWDRSVGSMTFAPDGQTLLATAQNLGHTSLFVIDVASGHVTELVHEGTVRSPAYGGAGIVFGLDHFRSPVELYTARTDGSGVRPITAINTERLTAVQFGETEQMTFSGAEGDQVHAWLVKPVDFDPTRRYPVALLIHGGPQGSWSSNFHYRWNPQIYAAAGYATLMVNPHGSIGYGQAFTDAVTGDWGGKPLEDLQLGLAAALERYPWMDGSRACALGGSYGGYLINWIAGNWPDGFNCLVNHAGLFDQRVFYFGIDLLSVPEWEMGGPYWQNPAAFEEHNPALHVGDWRTPMLVIHGGLDYRVPLEHGIGTFTALQRQGIPSRFLYFPDENHWIMSRGNAILWHETVLEWLGRWTRE